MSELPKDFNFQKRLEDEMQSVPYAPLGLIVMPGCEELGDKVNQWLVNWHASRSSGERSPEEKGEQLVMPQTVQLAGSMDPISALPNMPTYSSISDNDFRIDVKVTRFNNGEGKAQILNSTRGVDLFILCDIGAYNVTYDMFGRKHEMSPDDHWMNLKRVIAANGGRAERINVIMPMLYEARQHRRTSRESQDCAVALQELATLGVTNIITFDAHDPRVQNAIPLTGFDNFVPSYQILKALFRRVRDLKLDQEHMMIISPDEGAMSRNIYYSTVLGLDMGVFIKRRDYSRVVNGSNPIIAHDYIGADVAGKDIFVADDILATGSSILDLAVKLKDRGARRIYAGVTFPLFTHGIEKFDQAVKDGVLTGVVSTNLTYRTDEVRNAPWFICADLSKYVAYIIASLNHNRSLSPLLNPHTRVERLIAKYRAETEE